MITLTALRRAHERSIERRARSGAWAKLSRLALTSLDRLSPPQCLTCATLFNTRSYLQSTGLCARCEWVCLEWRSRAVSGSLEAPWILSLASYHGPLHERLISAKRGTPADTLHLAKLMTFPPPHVSVNKTSTHMRRPPSLALIPIPPRRARLKSSGSSLPYELACRLQGYMSEEADLLTHALLRAKESPPQATLNRRQRAHAQRQSLTATSLVFDRHVCLIDDVCTTGATLEEGRRACLEAGARTVEALCLFSAR